MKQILVHATISIDPYLIGFAQPSDRWITPEAAAEAIGATPRHIRRLCTQGKLRHRKFGRLLRILASEVAVTTSNDRPLKHDAENNGNLHAFAARGLQDCSDPEISSAATPGGTESTSNTLPPGVAEAPPAKGAGNEKTRASQDTQERQRLYRNMRSLHLNRRTGNWERWD